MAEEKTNKNKPTGDEKKLWYVVRAVGGKEKKYATLLKWRLNGTNLNIWLGRY